MLDSDLAALYGVGTKTLNRAVRRNLGRFPEDFMFQLTLGELQSLRYQFGTSNEDASLRSQIVTSKTGRGGRRYLPLAFTEQGVAMLSSVLRSQRAVQVNVAIMRAFVRLRQLLATHVDLARKLEELERKCTFPISPQRRGHDPRLLRLMRRRVPLRGARALGPRHVLDRDRRRCEVPELGQHELPCPHIAGLLLHPDDLAQRRIAPH